MKPEKPKKPATPEARKLLTKLEALTARPGTEDEGKAAAKKLARLLKRYDFTVPEDKLEDMFSGHWEKGPNSIQVYQFAAGDWEISNAVKWAIESATGIACHYQAGALIAGATLGTGHRLSEIAVTISESFKQLWVRFAQVPSINPADRAVFMMGLYDGMMGELRPALLPGRAQAAPKARKARKTTLAAVPGVAIHPYTVAVGFGKQIRFQTPWNVIAGEIETLKQTPQQIAA